MFNMSRAYGDFKELLEMTEDHRNGNEMVACLRYAIDLRKKQLLKGAKEKTEYKTLEWVEQELKKYEMEANK